MTTWQQSAEGRVLVAAGPGGALLTVTGTGCWRPSEKRKGDVAP